MISIKLYLSFNSNSNSWILPGGTIEEFESPIEALIREVYEETAVVVDEASIIPLFYQKYYRIHNTKSEFLTNQLRYIARAKRIDTFVSDPAGSMTAVMWVDINNLHEYLKWGETTTFIQEQLKEFLNTKQ